ncbi:hypothetical protein ACFL6Y_01995 [Elusimicrobiota bacterium]
MRAIRCQFSKEKEIVINIGSAEKASNNFEKAFQAAQKRTSFTPKTGVCFASLEAAGNFLTPKRLELLHLIKEKSPRNLYRLAKMARRSFPGVFKDIELLSKLGLVKLTKEKASARRCVHPQVGYDAINLWIGI